MTESTIASTLDLASRNDGYLVIAGDPAVESLKRSGLVFTRPACEGYWIARLIVKTKPSTCYRGARLRWDRAAVDRGEVRV